MRISKSITYTIKLSSSEKLALSDQLHILLQKEAKSGTYSSSFDAIKDLLKKLETNYISN